MTLAAVPIGKIVGTFGLRGGVKILAGDAADFQAGMHLEARTAGGMGRELVLTAARKHGRVLVGTLQGISDRSAAGDLVGSHLFAHAESLPALPGGVHRDAELVGLKVVDERLGELGEVMSIAHYPAADMLVVGNALIPLQSAYGVTIDLAARKITTRLPDGFEELMIDARATRAARRSRPLASPDAGDGRHLR